MQPVRALLLAVLFVVPTGSAQVTAGVTLGVQAATANRSSVGGIEERSRLGFVGGLTVDVPLSPAVSLRPELLYSQKGFALEADFSVSDPNDPSTLTSPGTLTTLVDYLEVPVLVVYTLRQSSGLTVGLEAGPAVAYKLAVGQRCSGEPGFEASCDERPSTGALNDLDLGVAVGATVGSGPFGVGIRYTQGVVDIDAEERVFDVRSLNSVFSASLRYTFGAR